MNFDDQTRRYFGTTDLAAVPPAGLAAGIEHMRVDLGLEQDRSRRFALWALLYMLDAAPDLDIVFKDPADRDAARNLMDLSAAQADADGDADSGAVTPTKAGSLPTPAGCDHREIPAFAG